jgi:chloramphenicol-sensitive protein RarD
LLCPILTALLGFVILKEELKPNQWLAIGLSLTSCFLLGTGSLQNLLFSLVIAFSYAFYLIIQRVLKQYDKLVLLTLQLTVTFTILGPLYSYFNEGHALGADLYFFGLILLIALAFTIIPLFLNLFALKELKSGTIGILMYINPIINFVIAFLYFGEKTTAQQAAAYVLIFFSVIIYNLQFKKKPRPIAG